MKHILWYIHYYIGGGQDCLLGLAAFFPHSTFILATINAKGAVTLFSDISVTGTSCRLYKLCTCTKVIHEIAFSISCGKSVKEWVDSLSSLQSLIYSLLVVNRAMRQVVKVAR